MRRMVSLLAVSLLAVVGAACSAPPRSANPGEHAGAAPAGTSASVPAKGAGAGDGAIDAASLAKEGYRVVKRNDQTLYCRTRPVTGTMFASTVCLTMEQLQQQKRDVRYSQDMLNNANAAPCVGTKCGT